MIFMFKDTTMREDVISLVNDPDHKFRDYEVRRIVWLRKHLRKAVSIWNEDKPTIGNGHEVALGNRLTDCLDAILENIQCAEAHTL